MRGSCEIEIRLDFFLHMNFLPVGYCNEAGVIRSLFARRIFSSSCKDIRFGTIFLLGCILLVSN